MKRYSNDPVGVAPTAVGVRHLCEDPSGSGNGSAQSVQHSHPTWGSSGEQRLAWQEVGSREFTSGSRGGSG